MSCMAGTPRPLSVEQETLYVLKEIREVLYELRDGATRQLAIDPDEMEFPWVTSDELRESLRQLVRDHRDAL